MVSTMYAMGDLIISPFECAWLCNEEYKLKNSEGCFSFKAKGQNDVTLIFSSHVGNKRVQPTRSRIQRQKEQSRGNHGGKSYVVIIGSHCNSRLAIEKDGQKVHEVLGITVSATSFTQYWVAFKCGQIMMGYGSNPGEECFLQWEDIERSSSPSYLGLSAWDAFVCYRDVEAHSMEGIKIKACNRNQNLCAAPALRKSTGKRVDTLRDMCMKSLGKQLSKQNCFLIIEVAERLLPFTQPLLDSAIDFLSEHLDDIWRHESFKLVSYSTMETLLKKDRVNVTLENTIFDMVAVWADQRCLVKDRTLVDSLFSLVRFPQIGEEDLKSIKRSKYMNKSNVLQQLIEEATAIKELEKDFGLFISGGKRLVELPANEMLAQNRKRLHPNTKELNFMFLGEVLLLFSIFFFLLTVLHSPGDRNGVCYYLGTNALEQQFVNPSLTKKVSVSSSSPLGRFTDPRCITSRAPVQTLYAEPGLDPASSQMECWMQIDLGRKLCCNHYCLRNDNSLNFLRNWELQGSCDGKLWTSLSVHDNDATFVRPLQFASWPVKVDNHFSNF